MSKIIKPLSAPVNLVSGANTVSSASLVAVTNAHNAPESVIVVETAGEIMVPAGAMVFIEKEPAHNLTAAGGTGPFWATSIAYKA